MRSTNMRIHTVLVLEGDCASTIARTQLIPAAIEYQKQLADTIKSVGSCRENHGAEETAQGSLRLDRAVFERLRCPGGGAE